MFKRIFAQKKLESIFLDGVHFTIKHTVRKNMKRMILRIEKKSQIRLSSSNVSKGHLEGFIQENKAWIFEQHEKIRDIHADNTAFYFLGDSYCVKHHADKLQIVDDLVFIDPSDTKRQLDDFYKASARSHLPRRFEYWKEIMGLEANKLGFRLAKRRWGSCNSKRNISLNPYMMKLSYEMIDYIIVHELSHLVHLNHSKEFYRLVEKYIPSYRNIEKEIKVISSKML